MKMFKSKGKKADKRVVNVPKFDVKKVFSSVVNGSVWTNGILVKQMPFILLVVLLSLTYINNRFMYESELKQNLTLTSKLQNVKYRSLTQSKELLKLGRKSGVQIKLQDRGSDLEESFKPVVVID